MYNLRERHGSSSISNTPPTASMSIYSIYRVLSRRKPMEDPTESRLAKVLSALDLTALGIGSTLGVGVYVLAGAVAKLYAGPSVNLSFLIAAIASVLAGLCYAEFGARVPKAGSAYVYSYVTTGEFVAFVIGWILILEYAIGTASVVKGLSTYLDSLCGYAMRDFLSTQLPIKIEGLSAYPDIFAFTVTIIFAWAVASGAKESTRLNNVFTLLNLSVVAIVIIAGLFKVSWRNWSLPQSEIPANYGVGGFAPYGFAGIIRGAAVCFYGFIGFDCIATAGEEAQNPKKSIPFAVIASLFAVFLAYFGVSSVLTLMLPYYAQDESAPLPHVFRMYGWHAVEYLVTIGALFGLCASLMGAMFPLPRIVFAMANDGLLFSFLGEISEKYRTPFKGTLFAGLMTGILAAIFNLDQLVSMMSMGTLLAYTMVASCVLILRFEHDERRDGRTLNEHDSVESCSLWRLLINQRGANVPTQTTARIVTITVTIFAFWCFAISGVLSNVVQNFLLQTATYFDVAQLLGVVLPLLFMLYIISRQPTSSVQLAFKVPLVPWLPGVSMMFDICLMTNLDTRTWIRFVIWIAIGLTIYFCYGIRNSRLRKRECRSEVLIPRDASAVALLREQQQSNGNVPLFIMQNTC